MFKRNNSNNLDNNIIDNFQNKNKTNKSYVEGFFGLFQNKNSLKEGFKEGLKSVNDVDNKLPVGSYTMKMQFGDYIDIFDLKSENNGDKLTMNYLNSPNIKIIFEYVRELPDNIKKILKNYIQLFKQSDKIIKNDIIVDKKKIFYDKILEVTNMLFDYKLSKNFSNKITKIRTKLYSDEFTLYNDKQLDSFYNSIITIFENIINHPPAYYQDGTNYEDIAERSKEFYNNIKEGRALIFVKGSTKKDVWGIAKWIEFIDNTSKFIITWGPFDISKKVVSPYSVRIFTDAPQDIRIIPDSNKKAISIKKINSPHNPNIFSNESNSTTPNCKTIITMPDINFINTTTMIDNSYDNIVDICSNYVINLKTSKNNSWKSYEDILNSDILNSDTVTKESNLPSDAKVDLFVIWNNFNTKFSKLNLNDTNDNIDSYYSTSDIKAYKHVSKNRHTPNTSKEAQDYWNSSYPQNELLIEVASISLPLLFSNVLYVSKSGNLLCFTLYESSPKKNLPSSATNIIQDAQEDKSNMAYIFESFKKYSTYFGDWGFISTNNIFDTFNMFTLLNNDPWIENINTTPDNMYFNVDKEGYIKYGWNFTSRWIPKNKKNIIRPSEMLYYALLNYGEFVRIYELTDNSETSSSLSSSLSSSSSSSYFVNNNYPEFGITWKYTPWFYPYQLNDYFLQFMNEELNMCCSCMNNIICINNDNSGNLGGVMTYKKIVDISLSCAVEECQQEAISNSSPYYSVTGNQECYISNSGFSPYDYGSAKIKKYSSDIEARKAINTVEACNQPPETNYMYGGKSVSAIYNIPPTNKCRKFTNVQLVLDDGSFTNTSCSSETMTTSSSDNSDIGLYVLLQQNSTYKKKWIYNLTDKYGLKSTDLISSNSFGGSNKFPTPAHKEVIGFDNWLSMGQTFVSRDNKLLVYLDAMGVLRINISLDPHNNTLKNIKTIYNNKFKSTNGNDFYWYRNYNSDKNIFIGNIPTIITTKNDFETRLYSANSINHPDRKDNKLSIYITNKATTASSSSSSSQYFYLLQKTQYAKNIPSQYLYLHNTIIPPFNNIINKNLLSKSIYTQDYLSNYNYLETCLTECDKNNQCVLAEYTYSQTNTNASCNLYSESSNQSNNILNYLTKLDDNYNNINQKIFMKLQQPQTSLDTPFTDSGFKTINNVIEYMPYSNTISDLCANAYFINSSNINNITTQSKLPSQTTHTTDVTYNGKSTSCSYIQYPCYSNYENNILKNNSINNCTSQILSVKNNRQMNSANNITASKSKTSASTVKSIGNNEKLLSVSENFTNINNNYYDMNSEDFFQKILDDTTYINNLFLNSHYNSFKSNSDVNKIFVNRDDMINTMILTFILVILIIIFCKIYKK